MNRNFTSYISVVAVLFLLIAFIPSELSMVMGATVFALAAIGMPFAFVLGMAIICSAIFSLSAADFYSGILMALSFIIPGWLQGFFVRKRKSLSIILSVTATVRGGLLLACYSKMAELEKVSVKDFLIGDFPQELVSDFRAAGLTEDVIKIATKVWDFIGNMIPSVILISGLSFAFLSLAFTKFMTRRTPAIFEGMRRLSDINVDLSFTVCAILIVVCCFVESEIQFVFINCMYVLLVIYSATGFAFIYRLIKKGVKMPVIAFIITAVTGFVSFGILLPAAGLISSFFKTDYDKKIKINAETNADGAINKNDED